MSFPIITPDQLAVISPSKNQPEKVRRLLECFVRSNVKPAQIIIANGGGNLRSIVGPFTQLLNCMCLDCPEAGQILQRNFAHKHLLPSIKIVIHLDDDITFGKDALNRMIDFWNNPVHRQGRPLAGASFNLIDIPKLRNSPIRKLFFLNTEPKGLISSAGYAAPFCPASQTHDVDWLLGGATAWSREVIDLYKHPMSFPTRWAVCEDLMYSYPLRNSYRMAVVHDAIMLHNDTYSTMSSKKGMFYGASSVIMRYHFVQQNQNLSTLAFFWMSLGILAGHLARGVIGSKRHLGLFSGGVKGLIEVLFNHLMQRDSKSLALKLVSWKF